MASLDNFNAQLYGSIAQKNASDLLKENPLLSFIVNYGSQLGTSYLSDLILKRSMQPTSKIVEPFVSKQVDLISNKNISNAPSYNQLLDKNQKITLTNPLNKLEPGKSNEYFFQKRLSNDIKQSFNSSPLNQNSTLTDPTIELKQKHPFLDKGNSTGDVDNMGNGITGNLTGAAASMGGGIAGSLAGQGLGNLLFDTDSKGGAFASGALSTVGSSVGSTLGSNLASTGSLSLNSLGSAASLGQGAMGLANVALDTFDPVKKSKGENIAGLGLGALGTAAALAGIPGVGWAAGAALLAANLAGHLSGRKTNSFTMDKELFSNIGSSYLGSMDKAQNAQANSNVKFSGFNSGGLRKANAKISEGDTQQKILQYLYEYNNDRQTLAPIMTSINGNRIAFNMQGNYDQSAVTRGKLGMKIQRAKNILNKYKQQQTNQLQEGGTLDPFEYYLNSLPENQRDSTNFRVKDYWIFNGKPKDFKEARRRGMFTQDKAGLFHARSIAENPETGEIEYMKASSHPTRYMESDWYEKGLIYNEDQNGNTITIQLKPGVPGYEDWKQFTNDYELVKSEPYWKYVKRQQKEIPSHKDGGTFIEISVETSIELVDPTSVPEFQNGGSINVIPDGALHARKHNMDVDKITKKGIPVVSEKDGEIEQQAEIEKEEIIFRLEVTQKLEELEKKFYSDEFTQEEKDECALEAGKLLVSEILYNTQDNTGKLLK